MIRWRGAIVWSPGVFNSHLNPVTEFDGPDVQTTPEDFLEKDTILKKML